MLNKSLIGVLFMLSFISTSKASYYICSSLEQNIDYKGNDLTYSYAANTVQLCADLCSSLKSVCTGFTFWDYSTNKICFLKNFTSTPIRFSSNGRSSCIMVYVPSTTKITTTSTIKTSTQSKSSATTVTFSTTKTASTTLSTTASSASTTISTTSGPSKCFTETEAFFGFSDSADIQAAQSVADCCDSCINAGANCIAFSYLADQTICYIYFGTLQEKIYRVNTTSGFVNQAFSTAAVKIFKKHY